MTPPTVTLEINNSTCQLAGLTKELHNFFKQKLSYATDNYFAGPNFPSRRYLIDKKGYFPTGLLYIVKAALKTIQNAQVTIVDRRTLPTKALNLSMSLPYQPYPEQEEAAEACKKYSRGIVQAPTGLGKTLIAALIINKLKVRTLVVVPSLELKSQVTKSLKEFFPSNEVGAYGSDIAVENVDALSSSKSCPYDCVIIDEFHRSGAATYRKLNTKAWNGVYFKFGLTATPFRTNDNERLLLESVLSQVIYSLPYEKAVELKRIVPVEAYYIEIPKRPVEGYQWAEVYQELVVGNKERNAIIAKLLTKLAASGSCTLCLVKEIKHGETLQQQTIPIPQFIKGENKDNRTALAKFNSKASGCLIGTTGVLGEGVDTKPVEFVVIAGLGKARGQFMQQVGRGVRRYGNKESCKVVIFKDRSHKWTIQHFNQQVKILKEEYGIIPAKLEL